MTETDSRKRMPRFWNADRMALIGCYPTSAVLPSPLPAIRSLAFSADGAQIAVGYENGYIEIYPTMYVVLDIETALIETDVPFRLETVVEQHKEPVHKIHDRADRIQSLAYSPKGHYLAVGCADGNFDVYDVKNQFKNLHFKTDCKLGNGQHLQE